MNNSNLQSLHGCHVHKLWSSLNRTYALFHSLAIVAIFYYRGSFFLSKNDAKYRMVPYTTWLLLFAAEIILSFLWVTKQPYYWRLVTRTVFPERLPVNEALPGIDVFVCTADPNKEPTFGVMNTVISAMALGYPVDKLNVYLSDDGGASVTLNGIKEAWVFATWWLPFCRKYSVKCICPRAYLEEPQEEIHSREYHEDWKIVKEKYEIFQQRVEKWTRNHKVDDGVKSSAQDHPALVQVINENAIEMDAAPVNPENVDMPTLVYVSREKRPSHPHHFKAGALNVLLRVSSTVSNSPYVLVLDCDMYCNSSVSARQAMCFYMDPKISPTLGWVQYPQKFHNISKSDIYDSQMRLLWTVNWPALDGLQGPILSGTNFYINRKALFDINLDNSVNIEEIRGTFGSSNEFIKSLSQHERPNAMLLKEAEYLASCTYEKDTKWGEKVGFSYFSVLEDVMTGSILRSKGWRSMYLNPPRPQFLGTATTNLNEYLIQNTRWVTGLFDISLSKYSPLLQSSTRMSYSWITLCALDSIPISCFAIIPAICFLYGVPLYPELSNPFFVAFAFAFLSSRLKHLCEASISGGSVWTSLNEQRIWMIKGVTCYVYGALDSVTSKLGLREASFVPTNKAGDDDTTKWYQMGKYDFRTSNMFLVPLVTVVTLNMFCFVGGVARVIVAGNWTTMFGQVLLSFYVLLMSFPVIQGMFLRKDVGRIALSATLTSSVVSMGLLSLGYLTLLY